jgi:hypothetical protein
VRPTIFRRHSFATITAVQPYWYDSLRADIEQLQRAWRRYHRSSGRDAVYELLGSIWDALWAWEADQCGIDRAYRAVAYLGCKPPACIDPFAALLIVAAHPTHLSSSSRSRWLAALRYAAHAKRLEVPIQAFFAANGGISACSRNGDVKAGA